MKGEVMFIFNTGLMSKHKNKNKKIIKKPNKKPGILNV